MRIAQKLYNKTHSNNELRLISFLKYRTLIPLHFSCVVKNTVFATSSF